MSLNKVAVSQGVTTVGGLLPADMLERIATGKDVTGATPADYRLYAKRDTVQDAAERSWTNLRGVWQAYRDELDRQGADVAERRGGAGNDRPFGPPAVGLTRERWLLVLFEELRFGRLHTVPGGGLRSADDEQKHFPVSHQWEHIPVHLTGWNVDLDQRTPGVAATAPQSMLQEYLSRGGPRTLWGLLSNGRRLRLLRDATSMTGAAYIEFDLQTIFDGDLFPDFLLLWRLLHSSRFEPRGEPAPGAPHGAEGDETPANPATCWLETWRTEAAESGTRALDLLRDGVETALTTLGSGFLAHPDNQRLRDQLETSELSVYTYHRALLRIAYRLLFCFVAEDRDILIPPDADPDLRTRYEEYFSTARLRRTAQRLAGGPHGDQWQALRLVLDGLGRKGGLPQLGLPALGGLFEETETDRALQDCELANEDLFAAVKALSVVRDPKIGRFRTVDYRHLGSEEFGSVYESLLDRTPRHDPGARTFQLTTLPGNERKTTGSYYTPTSLVECLLDSALDPVLDDAVKSGNTREEQERALLEVTVCDPACGSGHFLVAAARRIAKRLAAVRTDDPEPGADALRTALRDVVGRCVYGVDFNLMAVELAKVSLWLETLEPGKPLSFLDAHIKHGNGLLGATPALVSRGLPEEAFQPIEGDEKDWATALKKRNKAEIEAWQDSLKHGVDQLEMFEQPPTLSRSNASLRQRARGITEHRSEELEDVHEQRDEYKKLTRSDAYRSDRKLADAWCAAFVCKKSKSVGPAITTRTLLDLQSGARDVPQEIRDEIDSLSRQYRFFHWHLEFPEIFRVPEDGEAEDTDERTGWAGGFSCVLGNPPWETVEFSETEFFGPLRDNIANAPNKAARQRLIDALAESNEEADLKLYAEYTAAKRESGGMSHFVRSSGRYPLTGSGKINTYSVFAETASHTIGKRGYFGLVLQTGIATDATTAPFFSGLVRTGRLASFLDFENEAFLLSRAVDHRVRFCLLTAGGRAVRVREASFAFRTRYMADLPERRFSLPPEEILLVNPNTGTLPVFSSRRDAEITLGIYRRVPVLLKEGDPAGNPWGLTFRQGLFNMASDSHLFRTREQLEDEEWQLKGNVFVKDGQRMLPLYEAKMLHHFDHRLGTYEGQTEAQANVGTLPRLTPEQHDDPEFVPMPRYWAPEFSVPTGKQDKKGNPTYWAGAETRLKEREWEHRWLMGWRDIARASDERTMIGTFLPPYAVGHTNPLMFPRQWKTASAFQACLASYVFDYVIRQKIAGTHLTYGYLYQLPVPRPDSLTSEEASFLLAAPHGWIERRVLELTYTAHDMFPFARDLGDDGPPFRWDEERRALLRAELDAAYFHLYGVERDDVDYIMDTFPVVKKREEQICGSYRTKELILDIYDRMAEAAQIGTPYQTMLDPPPGEGPRHPARV